MPQKMPNLSRNLPRNVTYYLLSSFHTYSEAVMIVPVLGRERKYFPQSWRPHSLVDMVSSNYTSKKVDSLLSIDRSTGHSYHSNAKSTGQVHYIMMLARVRARWYL